MRKTAFFRGHRAADQRLYFRYIYSAISLLPKSETSSHLLWLYSPVRVGNSEEMFSYDAAHMRRSHPGEKDNQSAISCDHSTKRSL